MLELWTTIREKAMKIIIYISNQLYFIIFMIISSSKKCNSNCLVFHHLDFLIEGLKVFISLSC